MLRAGPLGLSLVCIALGACAKKGDPEARTGILSSDFDRYTGETTLEVKWVVEPRVMPDIDRSASDYRNRLTVRFFRQGRFGDVIALGVRHECSFVLDGERRGCIGAPCSAATEPVRADALLDGTAAVLPAFHCKGWGPEASDYSAAFSRWAVRRIASSGRFWLRLPSGEVALEGEQLVKLRDFVQAVDGTPFQYQTGSVDLSR